VVKKNRLNVVCLKINFIFALKYVNSNKLCCVSKLNCATDKLLSQMFIKQKKIQLLIFITLTQCLAFGQNFAYIHRDSVLYNTPNYVNNIKKTDSLTQAYKNEIKVAQESLQQKLNDLLSKYSPKEGETLDILRARMTAIDTTSLGILTDEDIMFKIK
jgi:hypothetical protein